MGYPAPYLEYTSYRVPRVPPSCNRSFLTPASTMSVPITVITITMIVSLAPPVVALNEADMAKALQYGKKSWFSNHSWIRRVVKELKDENDMMSKNLKILITLNKKLRAKAEQVNDLQKRNTTLQSTFDGLTAINATLTKTNAELRKSIVDYRKNWVLKPQA